MGISTSKTKTTSNSNRTENVTQTPTNPPFVQQPIEDLMGRVGAYGGRDPTSQVAPASPLQQQAFRMAGGLGGGGGLSVSPIGDGAHLQGAGSPYAGLAPDRASPLPRPAGDIAPGGSAVLTTQGGPAYGQAFDAATRLALSGGNAPANSAGFAGYFAPQTAAATWQSPQVQSGQIGSAQGAAIPSIGDVAAWQASLIDPASIPIGGPGQAGPAAFGPAGQAGQVALDPATQAARVDASRLIGGFMNPYTTGVYDTTLADFDANSDRVRATQAAAAAASGAFRGSRNALERSFTEGELARGRAATGANVLNTGFQSAVQAALQQAGLDANVNVANAGFTNDRNIAQGNIARDIGIANARNVTDMGIAQGRANADIGISNARNLTDYSLGAGDIAARIALANQQWQNNAQRDEALAANDFRTREFGERSAAERERTTAANDFARTQFLSDAERYRQQADLEARARSEGAAADNATRLANADRAARAGEFTAGAYNTNQQFNAAQRDAALNRRLQAANSIGSLASAYADAYRGDTALTAQLGDQQRQIDQQQRLAELAQLQAMAQIYGGLPLGMFQGQNTRGTQTAQGTETRTQQGSLFDNILAGIQTVGSLAKLAPSDRALKRDVDRIGRTPHGLGLYRYRYLWDPDDRPRRTGVMADEVARIVPAALGPRRGGFATVDYRALGLAHLLEE